MINIKQLLFAKISNRNYLSPFNSFVGLPFLIFILSSDTKA